MTQTFKKRIHSLRDKLLFSTSTTSKIPSSDTPQIKETKNSNETINKIQDLEIKFDTNSVLLSQKPGVKWDDIVGLADVKQSYIYYLLNTESEKQSFCLNSSLICSIKSAKLGPRFSCMGLPELEKPKLQKLWPQK
jgi:hypothetical protein